MVIYYKEYSMLSSFSFVTKETCGNIDEAVLYIENSGNKHKLLLKNPKLIPIVPSTTIRDLFKNMTTNSVKSFIIFGEQNNRDVLWRIEIWGNSGIANSIQCSSIEDMPKDEK